MPVRSRGAGSAPLARSGSDHPVAPHRGGDCGVPVRSLGAGSAPAGSDLPNRCGPTGRAALLMWLGGAGAEPGAGSAPVAPPDAAGAHQPVAPHCSVAWAPVRSLRAGSAPATPTDALPSATARAPLLLSSFSSTWPREDSLPGPRSAGSSWRGLRLRIPSAVLHHWLHRQVIDPSRPSFLSPQLISRARLRNPFALHDEKLPDGQSPPRPPDSNAPGNRRLAASASAEPTSDRGTTSRAYRARHSKHGTVRSET